jgi:ABC-type lipoprotein release transport system permease subunit
VGLIRDARSRDDLRRPIRPTAYFPFHMVDAKSAVLPQGRGTFVVRTRSQNPMALASTLRQEVPRARSEFYVSNVRAQSEIDMAHHVRERLLAMLAFFFAVIAVLLAAIGLYGVLDYGVLQRRREIGIRLAIGAQAGDIARRVTADAFSMVIVGAVAGVALGMLSVRYIETLLYGVKGSDPGMLLVPSLTILAAASLASLPAVVRAVRIDPVEMLRSE